MHNVAWIIGCDGQDGTYLRRRLTHDGCRWIGTARRRTIDDRDQILDHIDVLDARSVQEALERHAPDEVYYLAATHGSAEAVDGTPGGLVHDSMAVHVTGFVNVLEAVKSTGGRSRVVYAASSHVFGTPVTRMQNEDSPWSPECVYGISKATGGRLCRHYRDRHGLHASAAVLFNHESLLRPRGFLSMKVIDAACAVAHGELDRLVVGSLDRVVDWGYAPDYVDAMVRIVRHSRPADFVVATGKPHTVRDFARIAFEVVGLDAERHVTQDAALTPFPKPPLIGDASRLRDATGWNPSIDFDTMVRRMTREHFLTTRGPHAPPGSHPFGASS